MTKISILKSSYDLDNKGLLPVSDSLSQKVRSSSEIANEEEGTIHIDDTESSDSDMMESMSNSVCNYWEKRELKINTDFVVTE